MKKIKSILLGLCITAYSFAQVQCLSLNGTNASVTVPDLGVGTTNTISIEANIYSNGIQSSWSGIYIFSGFRSGLMLRTNNELGYMWEDANGNRYGWSSGLIVPQNQWCHVGLVITPTQATVYLDGKKATQVKACVASAVGASYIGSDKNQSGRFFNGLMSDIRVWKVSRTDAQMTSGFCSVVPSAETNLAAYFPCSTTATTTLTDTKAGKNGTIANGAFTLYANQWCTAPKSIYAYFDLSTTETSVGQTVNCTDMSFCAPDTQIKNWNWNITGATPSSITEKNPAFKYSLPGSYQITLTIDTGAVYNASYSRKILITPAAPLDRNSWKIIATSSLQAGYEGDKSIDDNTSTYWHTQYSPSNVAMPHYIVYDMNMYADIYGIGYVPRQDGIVNGAVTNYKVFVSNDGVNWGNAVATGTITYNDYTKKVISFANKVNGRYIKFYADQSQGSPANTYMACSEFFAYGNYTAAIKYDNDSTELASLLNSLTPVYTAPSWTDTKTTPNGPIMGNGDMHVILLGDVNKQTFHISESEMWSDKGGTYSTTGYRCIPTGGVDIYPQTATTAGIFDQKMDFAKANVTAVSKSNFKTETYVCATENVMVTKLWTDGSTAIPMAVGVWCKADATDLPSTAGINVEKSVLWATRSSFAGAAARWTTRNAIASTITGATTTLSTDGLGRTTALFTLQPGQIVEIRTVLKGKKGATTHLEEAISRVASLTTDSISCLKTKHQNWWNDFWFNHSYVVTHDNVLDKFYYGATYLMGCVNRREYLPAAQHPFCINDDPAWQGDYHLNQELMGQNCAFFAANRPELSDGAHQILLDYIPTGRDIAANKMSTIRSTYAPCKGICYNVGLGPWGINADNYFGSQVSNASWAGSMIIWNYYYNRDTTWLKNKGYEYIKALADFWVSHLGAKVNGKYVDYGAGQEEYYGKNPCTDLGLIRFVMKAATECSIDLGVDADQRPIWKDIIDNLSDYPTYVYGGKKIFQSYDGWNNFDQRGAYSCLEQIWPAEAINLSTPFEVREIAHNTLDLCDYVAGPKMAIYGARTGYPIEKNMKKLKSGKICFAPGQWSGLRQNGTIGSFHGNGEFMEFIHNSFLQSQEDFIRIFPAWYKNKPAKFKGLKTKGAFLVDAELDANGNIIYTKITSTKGGDCSLLNIYPGYAMYVMEDGVEIPSTVTNEISTFKTKEGSTYTFGKRSSQTITFEAIPTLKLGQEDVTVNASASSGLPVTLTSSNTSVIEIVNSKLHILAIGSATITASQPGNELYSAAPKVSQTVEVSGTNGLHKFWGESINIYPNPASSQITIRLNCNTDVSIYSSTGKLIYSLKNAYGDVKVNTKNWGDGVYYANLKCLGEIQNSKLVIQHQK